jgi:hypothetical protein
MRGPTTLCLFIFLFGTGSGSAPTALAASNIPPHGGSDMSQTGSTEKPNQSDDQSNVVITPAGPMPKDNVHPVKPGEKVRRKDDGSLEVVPANKDESGKQ